MSLACPVNLKSITTKHQLETNEFNEKMVRLNTDIPLQCGSSSLCTRLPRAEIGNSGVVETTLGSPVCVGLRDRWPQSEVCPPALGPLCGFELQRVPVRSGSNCNFPRWSKRLALWSIKYGDRPELFLKSQSIFQFASLNRFPERLN